MKLHSKDYLLVGLQGILFITYLFNIIIVEITLPFLLNMVGLAICSIGVFTMIIALLQLNKNLSPFPTPKSNSELIQSGLYKYIRHPIYTGILLICIGYTMYTNSLYKAVITLLLLILFVIKSNYEEKRLCQKFNNYNQYKKGTGRFFPKMF